jgi:hypothetical protein
VLARARDLLPMWAAARCSVHMQRDRGVFLSRGGACPDGPAFILKAGLTSAAEVAWSKVGV